MPSPSVLLRGCALTVALACSTALAAYELPAGSYILGNHPDGTFNPAGERLYGLVISDFADQGTRTLFDFEHPDAKMTMTINKNRIFIHGTAIGRVKVDGVWVEREPYEITFVYRDNLEIVTDGGMNDYVVRGTGTNTGTVTNMVSGVQYPLIEKANNAGISFRLGDRGGNGIRMSGHVADLLADPTVNVDYADGPGVGNGSGGTGGDDGGDGGDGDDDTPVPVAAGGWGEGPPPTDFIFFIKSANGKKPADG